MIESTIEAIVRKAVREELAAFKEELQALEDHHRERQHAALQARDKETARDHRSEANQAESVRSHLEEILEELDTAKTTTP